MAPSPRVDLRGDGGWIVVAPSPTSEGMTCRWLNNTAPGTSADMAAGAAGGGDPGGITWPGPQHWLLARARTHG